MHDGSYGRGVAPHLIDECDRMSPLGASAFVVSIASEVESVVRNVLKSRS